MMMSRTPIVMLGLLVLGIALTITGWLMTPAAIPPPTFPGPINVTGQSLLAFGLTFIVIGVALFFAWARETAEPAMA